MDARTDDQLVRAAARGDAAAFETLYFRHRDFVYRVAFRFTRRHAAALDVAQDAFAYLLGKLPSLRLSGKLSTYLYPVVKNLALAQARRAAAESKHRGARPLQDEPAPTLATGDLDPHLATAIDALPDSQREVLTLRVVDGLSVEEVGLALGVPDGTVKSRLHSALAALRSDPNLRGYFEDKPGGG